MKFAFRLLFLLSTAVAFTSVSPLFASSLSSGLQSPSPSSSSLPLSRLGAHPPSSPRANAAPLGLLRAGAFAQQRQAQHFKTGEQRSGSASSSLKAVPHAGAAAAAKVSGTGTATMSNEVFNLVKNIVGAGVLSLPAGVAAFGDHPGALVPGTALIVLLGLLSAYCFSIIGE